MNTNRRNFLGAATIASFVNSRPFSKLASASSHTERIPVPEVYTRIGVQPFINLTATYTINGGTLTLPEVKEAQHEASQFSVDLDELMVKVGARLSELLGCESAIVTSGAAAALSHATAACLVGCDPELMQQLPDLTGLKNEVIIPRQSRNVYDHAIRVLGVKMVQIDSPEEFHAALGARTAMIAVLGTGEALGKIRLEELTQAGKKARVPVLVDAAAELPQKPNPYLSRGADLVAYSGGKVIRGPQCAGLLIGRKDLIRAAWINSSPHHAFGRMMKVGKEEILGMLAAIEVLMRRGIEEDYQKWRAWLEEIGSAVTKIPGVLTEMNPPAGASPYPTMTVRWDPEKIGITAGELYRLLLDGEPRIMSHASGEGFSFLIRPPAMKSGDERLVARRLQEIFSKAPKRRLKDQLSPPVSNLTGRWEVAIDYEVGSSKHTFFLETQQNHVEGTHLGRKLRGALSGTIDGDRIHFRSGLPYEGTRLGYEFTGQISNELMRGEVDLGEYGRARWLARRYAKGQA